jgi:CxxC motif-containing protein (DUF1111 family)
MKLPRLSRIILNTRWLARTAAISAIASGLGVGVSVGAKEETVSNGEVFVTHELGDQAYSMIVTEVAENQRSMVSSGRRMINDPWVLPTEFDGIWGVGPTFNENSCPACHARNGRARAPDDSKEVAKGLLVRLSVPGDTDTGAPRPHPQYGDQFQNRGVRNQVPSEGKVFVNYEPVVVHFADNEQISLRKPVFQFTRLTFGELGEETIISARIAPSLVGLGLLEAITEETVLAIAREQSEKGLNGKPNYVWDIETGQTAIGRFGWKANQPNLLQQTAAAFHGDIGATSSLFPAENCPSVQTDCMTGPTATGCNGGHVKCADTMSWEVFPSRLRNITRYLQALAVPAQRNSDDPEVMRGKELFSEAQCGGCHMPEIQTGNTAPIAAAANLTIHPYTDLLLHDMGVGLADDRPDFQATGRQWRTPPLWGLGLQQTVNGHTDLLHDGRARGFVEAIAWHGGEAQNSRDRFLEMDKGERDALVRFLESL